MNTPQPPPAPDPTQTAAAQTASNRQTAITNFGLNAVNQNTPQGSLSYRQIGTWDDGTPRYEANTSLSPEQQQLYNLGNQTQQNIGRIGVEQSAKIGKLLDTPVNLSNDATEARLGELSRKRLDPIFAQRSQDLESDLINRGVRPGTEAYDRARAGFGRDQNDAYNQMLLSGHGQAVQEALTERNQPINEIAALLSGSQVSQPNFANTPQSNVQPTDVASITNQAYQNSLVPYQAATQRQNAMMGGLFGLGGAALGGWGRQGFPGLSGLFGLNDGAP